VVHIFHQEKRPFYSLEDLWGDAPRFNWEACLSNVQQKSAPAERRGG
jgi:hypothetical protein